MKNFLLILEMILGLIVVVTILMQPSKADALSGLIQGGTTETFFSKNKTKTKEVMLARATVVSMSMFAIVTVALNLI
ncbi:preprotein translocase subunit SecG [Clostridium gasigenes]|uniref:Protein-export membrane protein SecG n=1 Tax=Clostridium gasigenes TaxID=94869 RepID=A0A7X0V7B0_9CLOT|nr:preprotein translocase subunit SecG [Clostridium gasigenes]MBB6624060.1 preprotein translocase subunit SecG [Clostridium gasigenes]MBB6716475.1 preprotein translocase subunit SecG [Clostridium gasigenes]MBU3088319.1 preprotein translocase subunit SecG [Clostridium gasigenes]MBU3103334.1 preprotein translocase subunit SecG [Clostridium gasigenes]MBU3108719.1 preprotein translocase subunit SecG [Clostridium gasigenes]